MNTLRPTNLAIIHITLLVEGEAVGALLMAPGEKEVFIAQDPPVVAQWSGVSPRRVAT